MAVPKTEKKLTLAEMARLVHDLLDDFRPMFNAPRFTIKRIQKVNPRITYRKINDWEKRKLISPKRNSGKCNWRRFSILETVLLLIIEDLKTMGIASEYIRTMVKALTDKRKPKNGFLLTEDILEFLVLHSWARNLMAFAILADGTLNLDFPTVLFERVLKRQEDYGMFVYVPFSDYVVKAFRLLDLPISTKPVDVSLMLDSPLREVIHAVSNREFDNVEVLKSNGVIVSMKATRIERGDFTGDDILLMIASRSFQTVTITQKDDKTVVLKQSEVIRIGR